MEKVKLSDIVREFEKSLSRSETQVNVVKATLLENFGVENKKGFPKLVRPEMEPDAAMILVLEHFLGLVKTSWQCSRESFSQEIGGENDMPARYKNWNDFSLDHFGRIM